MMATPLETGFNKTMICFALRAHTVLTAAVANASMKLKKKMGDTPMTSASCSKLEMPLVIASATATHMIALLGPSIDGPPPQQPHTCIDAPTVPRIPATT